MKQKFNLQRRIIVHDFVEKSLKYIKIRIIVIGKKKLGKIDKSTVAECALQTGIINFVKHKFYLQRRLIVHDYVEKPLKYINIGINLIVKKRQ